ncbi:sensor histidine kinase [Calothrix sp. 336/3]|uniref:sensor histidine kinase n=1 Tax=Calothrix sp. 336/3 TaxID=1337936 RepID=UPI0004E2E4A1|nr:sensor histidine kinase [Calothrix sp. 336/3]AKG24760.1 ATPase [Calothrix sp. 336/3]
MSRPIRFDNHPFKFLLYLEWFLLGFAIISSSLPYPWHRYSARFPEATICCLLIFCLMGLQLPTGNRRSKIIYTVVEFLLILITGQFGIKTARLFPFLFVIIVTRSCLIFGLKGRVVVTILAFLSFLVTFQQRFPNLSPRILRHERVEFIQEKLLFFQLSFALLFGLSLVFILLLMNTLLSEWKNREQLADANQKLRKYALKIENQATLEERNRIAREIHDSLGHSLTALNLQLETAVKLWQSNPEKALLFLTRAKELGSKSLQDVRQSVSTMRSNPLQNQSLEEAIASLIENINRSTGLMPICNIQIHAILSTEVSMAIYRIIQESLTNICKYAQATQVILELMTVDNHILLRIIDNGIGFNLIQNTTGFGLQSMRDRALSLGGNIYIDTAPNRGCTIEIKIPLSES